MGTNNTFFFFPSKFCVCVGKNREGWQFLLLNLNQDKTINPGSVYFKALNFTVCLIYRGDITYWFLFWL